MNKIISGKTILLNTITNNTFIANEVDELVQTGSRENDKHIEWVGELDVPVCEHQYKPISHILWGLLDDIDTSSDIIRPTTEKGYKIFYENTLKRCSKRFKYLSSDGYNLEKNISPEPNLKK